MTRNLLFFDTETSGLNHERNVVLQIAWVLDSNGEIIGEQCHDLAVPFDAELNYTALKVNGITLERITKGIEPTVMMEQLRIAVSAACRGYGSVIPCGHNARFDIDFLHSTAKRSNHAWWCNFGASVDLQLRSPVCTLALSHYLAYKGVLSLPNYRLETLCKFFDIPLTPHDALEDVRATRKLFYKLDELLKGEK